MIDSKQYLVIDLSNYRQFAASAPGGLYPQQELTEVLQGRTGYLGWQDPNRPKSFGEPAPLAPQTPREQWAALIQAGAGQSKLLGCNLPAKDQDGLSLCWCYGSTRAVELLHAGNGETYLELAPECVDVECNGGRNEGGYATEAFTAIEEKGICLATYLDRPNSLRPRFWKAGWEENALLHRAATWYEIGTDYADVITALLQDIPVAAGLDWWGHLICYVAPVLLPDGSVGVLFQNSWGADWPSPGANGYAILVESLATPDGAAAPFLKGV